MGSPLRRRAFAVRPLRPPGIDTVITAPAEGSSKAIPDVVFTVDCTPLDTGLSYYCVMELDTAWPPDSGNADYQIFTSGYTVGADTFTFVATDLTANTWYARARGETTTHDYEWGPQRSFYTFEKLLLRQGARFARTMAEFASQVVVRVQNSDPSVEYTATQTTGVFSFALIPRTKVVYISAGDAALCQAIAEAQLAYWQIPQVEVTGLELPLKDGVKLQIGTQVAVESADGTVSGWYPVLRLGHSLSKDVTTVTVGPVTSPPSSVAGTLRKLFARVATLEKEAQA